MKIITKTGLAVILMVCVYSGAYASGKTMTLSGFANDKVQTPTFDCEGDGIHRFTYQKSTLGDVGQLKTGKCTLSPGFFIVNREFHLQSRSETKTQFQNVLYKINTTTGSIAGNAVLKQKGRIFKLPDGSDGVMNYGVSHASPPITNQAYIYTGPRHNGWMGQLQSQYSDLKFSDLVLPGAHDAGMYEMTLKDTQDAVAQLCGSNVALDALCKAGVSVGAQALENFSITQKDDSATQMDFGTRYFDFRPAYLKTDSHKTAYHVHNFITGASFADFLTGVNHFLASNAQEIAVVQIKDSGIQESSFQPLSKAEVKNYLVQYISSTVGYDLVEDLRPFNDVKLADLATSGKRLIVLYGNSNVNDSYSDAAYSQSLTDATSIITSLQATIQKTGTYQFTMLQLQDTGSSALVKHYVPVILKNPTSWANNLLASGTGNILQATKPLFDQQTYSWLTTSDALSGIAQQSNMVVLLNDFVEVGLSAHAIGLTIHRYKQRKGVN
jgi:hypothetical protein